MPEINNNHDAKLEPQKRPGKTSLSNSLLGVWLPISSAPRDGTLFDVFSRKGTRCIDCRYISRKHQAPNLAKAKYDNEGEIAYWVMLNEQMFTHWMLKPNDPTEFNIDTHMIDCLRLIHGAYDAKSHDLSAWPAIAADEIERLQKSIAIYQRENSVKDFEDDDTAILDFTATWN